MTRIILLRHGDAEPDSGAGDAERALTGKGRRQATAAGRALRRLAILPDACLASPKKRALDTALLACAELEMTPIEEEGLARPDHRVDELAAGFDSVLLVGHEPMMSAETARLTGASVKFRKGGIALIESGRLKMLAGPEFIELAGP